MPTVYGTYAITLRDYRGYTARVNFMGSGADAATLVTNNNAIGTAIQACSNGQLAKETGTATGFQTTVTYGAAAQYADASMKLVVRGLDNKGRQHRLAVPIPKASCFLTDQFSMNAADANVAGLITALNAAWVSNDADVSPITVIDGSFVDRRRKRRLSPWTRSPIGGASPG